MSLLGSGIIKVNTKTEIILPLVAVEIARLLGVNDRIMFMLIVAYFVVIIWQARKIIIPKIYGLIPLIIFLVYGTFLGIAFRDFRVVTRDLYYYVPTLLIIVIGYFIEKNFENKSIEKTLLVIGAIIAINGIISTLLLGSQMLDLSTLRTAMGEGVRENCAIFALLFVNKIIGGKIYFSKSIDNVITALIVLQIVMSFGRTNVLLGGVIIVSSMLLGILTNKKQITNIVKKVAIWIVLMIAIVFAIYRFTPEDVLEEYGEKWENTSSELNANQEFKSTSDAMGNWRAYEIKCAQKQWRKANLLVEIFGDGLGKGVKVEYVPYTWEETLYENSLPILHNGYYMILPKGGLFGVFALIWFFLSGTIVLIRQRKKKKNVVQDMLLLAVLGWMMLACSYVLSGMAAQSFSLAFGLLVGSLNYKIRSAGSDDDTTETSDTSIEEKVNA